VAGTLLACPLCRSLERGVASATLALAAMDFLLWPLQVETNACAGCGEAAALSALRGLSGTLPAVVTQLEQTIRHQLTCLGALQGILPSVPAPHPGWHPCWACRAGFASSAANWVLMRLCISLGVRRHATDQRSSDRGAVACSGKSQSLLSHVGPFVRVLSSP